MTETNIHPQYPFNNIQGKLFFSLIVFSTFAIGVDICCDTYSWSYPNKLFIVATFIFVFSGFTVAFSLAKNFNEFFEKTIIVFLLFGFLVVHIAFKPSWILFLISFLIMAIWAVGATLPSNSTSEWDTFLRAVYVLWILTGIVLSVGELGFLPYHIDISESIRSNRLGTIGEFLSNNYVRRFLDFRYLFSMLFVVLLTVTACWEASQVTTPNIPRIPKFAPESFDNDSSSYIYTITYPFLFVTSFVLHFFHMIIDAVWRMLAIVCFYLYQFSSIFILQIYVYFTNSSIWKGIFKVIVSYFLVVTITYTTINVSRSILKYIRSPFSIRDYIKYMLPDLLSILGFFIVSVLLLSLFRAIWNGFNEWRFSLDRSAMAGAILVLSFTISGILLHLIDNTKFIDLKGFNHYGPFLILMAGLMGVFAFYAIVKQIYLKIRDE